ncbi:MAG: hypothetical protein ACK4GO_08500 [Gemmobacter sp.]
MDRIACILEWENAKGLDRDEARAGLEALAAQLADHAKASNLAVNLVLVHDDDVSEGDITDDIRACPSLAAGGVQWRRITAPGTTYYEKKGIATQFTDAEVLIYADSDCRYAPGWVAALTRPLLLDEADVTYGPTEARLEPGVVARASALAWTWATPHPKDPFRIELPDRFFANNVAIRREAVRRVPWPRLPGGRVTCTVWRGRLAAAGLRMRQVPEAAGQHKQFDAIGPLMARAWMLGGDRDLTRALNGKGRAGRIARGVLALVKQPLSYWKRFARLGHVYAPGWRWPLVLLIGTGFRLTAAAGQLASALTRSATPERHGYDDLTATARGFG